MIVNKRQLAATFGVSEETITQWQNKGMPIVSQRKGTQGNEYETADCIRWFANRDAGGDGALDLNQERARLAKAQADKTTLEAAELKGEMVRYEEISAHWTNRAAACRSRLLTIPSKIAPRVRAAVNDFEAAATLEVEICEALEEISGDGVPDSVAARRQRSERFAPTAREADGVGVGGQEPVPVERSVGRARKVAH